MLGCTHCLLKLCIDTLMLQSNPRDYRKASHSYEVPFHPIIMMVVIHVIMVQYIMMVRRDYKNWCVGCRFCYQ